MHNQQILASMLGGSYVTWWEIKPMLYLKTSQFNLYISFLIPLNFFIPYKKIKNDMAGYKVYTRDVFNEKIFFLYL